MTSTRSAQRLNAPRAALYGALLDPAAITQWRVPDGMTSQVHAFEPRQGGFFRVALTYDAPDAPGKTTAHIDTYHGHFEELASNEKVVEVIEFETSEPALMGEMRITWELADAAGGATELHAVHDGLPPGLLPADNELGWQMALHKLASLVESRG